MGFADITRLIRDKVRTKEAKVPTLSPAVIFSQVHDEVRAVYKEMTEEDYRLFYYASTILYNDEKKAEKEKAGHVDGFEFPPSTKRE